MFDMDGDKLTIRLMSPEEYQGLNEFDRNALDAFVEQIKKLPPQSNADVVAIRDQVAIAQFPMTDDELDTIAHVAYEAERAYAHMTKAIDITAWPSFRELPSALIYKHREIVRRLLATGATPTAFVENGSTSGPPADCLMMFEVVAHGFAQTLNNIIRNRGKLLFQAGATAVIQKLVARHQVKTVGMPYVGVVSPTMAKAMSAGTTIVDDPELRDEVLNLFKTHELPVYDGPDGVLIVQDSADVIKRPTASA
jgi:hypothetical protein